MLGNGFTRRESADRHAQRGIVRSPSCFPAIRKRALSEDIALTRTTEYGAAMEAWRELLHHPPDQQY